MMSSVLWPVTMWRDRENLGLTIGLAVVAFVLMMLMTALAWPMTLYVTIAAFVVGLFVMLGRDSLGMFAPLLAAICLGVGLGVWF